MDNIPEVRVPAKQKARGSNRATCLPAGQQARGNIPGVPAGQQGGGSSRTLYLEYLLDNNIKVQEIYLEYLLDNK